MFNQIVMSKSDQRKFYRFIWRYGNGSCAEPFVQCFSGNASSLGIPVPLILPCYPFACLHADVKEKAYRIGAKILKQITYIDDVANSVSDPDKESEHYGGGQHSCYG